MQYDGAWKVSLGAGLAPPAAGAWPVLANGQLAIVPSLDASAGVDATRSAIAVPPARGYGRSLPGFHFNRIRLALVPPPGSSPTASAPEPLAQALDAELSLDMMGGAMRAGCVDALTGCTITHDLRVLMHLPGCALHSVTVVVPAGLAPPGVGATLQVQHELRAPVGSGGGGASFSGESLSCPGSGGSFFALAGEAESSCVGEAGDTISATVACACTYLVECRNAASAGQQLPPPVYAEQRGRRAVATFYVSAAPSPTTSSPTTLRFHVLTSVATSLDAMPQSVMHSMHPMHSMSSTPSAAARRTLLAVASQAGLSGQVAAAVASSLVAAHSAAWAKRWITYVDVAGASRRVTWALRYAFYNLHACARPLGPAVDLAGTSLAGGRADDFVGTLMTLCAPACARSALEGRWASIAAYAAELANDAGYRGARFPHAGELDGDELSAQDRASAWWATGGGSAGGGIPARLHATSMAAVAAWNYYRSTQDGEWLSSRGYPIIAAAADMLSACCVQPDPIGAASTYRLPAAVGVDVMRVPSTDPALEVAAVVAAMRAATEAAYQLGFAPPEAWAAVRYGLSVKTIPGSAIVLASDRGGPTPIGYPVVAGSVAAQNALPAGVLPLAIAEPLLVFAEPVASLADALALNPGALVANLAYWGIASNRETSAPPLTLAMGDLVILHATAQAAQLGGQAGVAHANAFLVLLDDILDRHSDLGPTASGGGGGGWGNLRPAGGSSAAASPNDLGMSSLMLLAFVQGLAGALLQGGITQAQFVYSTLGVNAATTACLPSAWGGLTVLGLGHSLVDVVLMNNRGGGGLAGASFVSWSVNALTL
jgi:hypothetical protein